MYTSYIFLILGTGYSSSSTEFSYEDRVIKHLLRKYEERGKFGRPVQNYSDIINVTFGLQLVQIMNLDERKQILTLNVWTNYVSIHKKNLRNKHTLFLNTPKLYLFTTIDIRVLHVVIKKIKL